MIRSLPTHTLPVRTKPATTPAKSTATNGGFKNLVTPAVTAKPTEAPRLGPFTGDLNTHPATAAPKPLATITSSPYLPAGYPGDTDLMNKTQHEQTMNDWLQNYTKWSNDKKTQIYQQAMANWQLNDERCKELGIDSPPKPEPPQLDPVQPMPTGYWFQT